MNPCSFVSRVLSTVLLGCAASEDGPAPVAGQPPARGDCSAAAVPAGFVDCVDDFVPEPPASFGHDAMPDVVRGAPVVPPAGGSTDVASLGCGGSITVGFARDVTNGADADLIVFENAFATGDSTFAEPAEVLVSADGEAWFAFPCDYESDDAEGCAGVTPSLATEDARDPAVSGGDAFDLDALGLDRIRWVRLVDRTREHHGDDMWCTGAGAGFDLDAIAWVDGS